MGDSKQGWPSSPVQVRESGRVLRSPIAYVGIGLLFAVLGAWLLIPTVKHSIELRGGTHTTATVRENGEGALSVEFPAEGFTVRASLPVGTNTKMLDDGDQLPIVYEPGKPWHFAAVRDLGAEAIALPAGISLIGLVSITVGVVKGWTQRTWV